MDSGGPERDWPRMPEEVHGPTHDRTSFCKYRTAPQLLDLLRNLELRFSAPSLFNDPFDLALDLRFGFRMEDLAARAHHEIDRLIHSEEEPSGDPANPLFRTLIELRAQRHRLPRMPLALDGLRDVLARGEERLVEQNRGWREWLSTLRVLCLVEEPDNLLMWAHYAWGHTGGVVRLRCSPELDSPLWTAYPVTYMRELPVLADADYFVRRMFGSFPREEGGVFNKQALTKSEDWAYEREWRVLGQCRPGEESNPVRISVLHPVEIEAVYMGLKMTPADEGQVAKLLSDSLPGVELHRARKSEDRFAVEFERLR